MGRADLDAELATTLGNIVKDQYGSLAPNFGLVLAKAVAEHNKPKVKTNPRKFISIASKSHAHIAADLSDEIKQAIYKYSEQIPLVIAIGVLRIVEKEILDDA